MSRFPVVHHRVPREGYTVLPDDAALVVDPHGNITVLAPAKGVRRTDAQRVLDAVVKFIANLTNQKD